MTNEGQPFDKQAQHLRLWTRPKEVIDEEKRNLLEKGEPIVERLAECPLPVRLKYPIENSSETDLGSSSSESYITSEAVRLAMFQMYVYGDKTTGEEHVAVLKGLGNRENVPIRIHSSCLTAETFSASNCDCQEQLNMAMTIAEDVGYGGVIWLHQEGRGNGLAAKAMQLSKMVYQGMNTVEAYEALGLPSEQRDFTAAAHILQDLGIKSVQLITNNPDKIGQTQGLGIEVTGRIPCQVTPLTEMVRNDLLAKKEAHGHYFGKI